MIKHTMATVAVLAAGAVIVAAARAETGSAIERAYQAKSYDDVVSLGARELVGKIGNAEAYRVAHAICQNANAFGFGQNLLAILPAGDAAHDFTNIRAAAVAACDKQQAARQQQVAGSAWRGSPIISGSVPNLVPDPSWSGMKPNSREMEQSTRDP